MTTETKHTGAYLLTLQQCFQKCEMGISFGIYTRYGYVEGCAHCIITCMAGILGSMLMVVGYWMYLLRKGSTAILKQAVYSAEEGRHLKAAQGGKKK